MSRNDRGRGEEQDWCSRWLNYITLRALVWYLTAFLVCSFATIMWSSVLDTFCSMLFTISPWKTTQQSVRYRATLKEHISLNTESFWSLCSQNISFYSCGGVLFLISWEKAGKINHTTQTGVCPYLKQAFPSESMAQAVRNMWLDLQYVCMDIQWLTVCLLLVWCKVCSDVYDGVSFVHLTKCIHVGSVNVGWWDGGGGGRKEVKRGVRKAKSWKRHRCRLTVRPKQRQEEK